MCVEKMEKMEKMEKNCEKCTDGSDGVPDCVIDGVCPNTPIRRREDEQR